MWLLWGPCCVGCRTFPEQSVLVRANLVSDLPIKNSAVLAVSFLTSAPLGHTVDSLALLALPVIWGALSSERCLSGDWPCSSAPFWTCLVTVWAGVPGRISIFSLTVGTCPWRSSIRSPRLTVVRWANIYSSLSLIDVFLRKYWRRLQKVFVRQIRINNWVRRRLISVTCGRM